jgi:hypothetical protein
MTMRADLQTVVKMTMADLNHPRKRGKAIAWFMSSDTGEGSFLWICAALDIDQHKIKRLVSQMVTRGMIDPSLLAGGQVWSLR